MKPSSVGSTFLLVTVFLFHGLSLVHAEDSAASASPINNNSQGHLSFYPEIHADFRSDLDPNSDQDASDTGVTAALIYTKEMHDFSLLTEAYATDDDGDLQRLQLGWHYSTDGSVWLGRFYNPIGYWNTQHHRGLHNEISVHRPSIVEFENEGGILPMQLLGLYIEQVHHYENIARVITLAAGAGPELTKDAKLEAKSLLDPGDTESDISMTARLDFELHSPFYLSSGLFISRSTIPSHLGSITEVDQRIFGGYFNSRWSDWSLTWMLCSVTNDVKSSAAEQQSSFGGGYVQLSHQLDQHWTAYARVEDIASQNSDVYLSLFPDFIVDRNLVGLRLDFRKNQALTFEILDSNLISGDHFHTSVQWSAQFDYR